MYIHTYENKSGQGCLKVSLFILEAACRVSISERHKEDCKENVS